MSQHTAWFYLISNLVFFYQFILLFPFPTFDLIFNLIGYFYFIRIFPELTTGTHQNRSWSLNWQAQGRSAMSILTYCLLQLLCHFDHRTGAHRNLLCKCLRVVVTYLLHEYFFSTTPQIVKKLRSIGQAQWIFNTASHGWKISTAKKSRSYLDSLDLFPRAVKIINKFSFIQFGMKCKVSKGILFI